MNSATSRYPSFIFVATYGIHMIDIMNYEVCSKKCIMMPPWTFALVIKNS